MGLQVLAVASGHLKQVSAARYSAIDSNELINNAKARSIHSSLIDNGPVKHAAASNRVHMSSIGTTATNRH